MSEEENFVARWSRLKRDKAQERKEEPSTPSRDAKQDPTADSAGSRSSPQDATIPFDVSRLPSIESLTANSDIRAFLQSGVPAELTKAALRKVWTTDAAIRDFIGIAENQWDFTDPASIPGFGPLQEHDDVAKLVAQAMGKLEDTTQADVVTVADKSEGTSTVQELADVPVEADSAASAACDLPVERQQAKETAAVQHGEPSTQVHAVTNRRTHGRALPR